MTGSLEQEIRQVLLDLRMLSNAPASRFPSTIGTRTSSSTPKKGERQRPTHYAPRQHHESRPPAWIPVDYDHWAERFRRAEGNERALRLTLWGAREVVDRARKAPKFFGSDGKPETDFAKTKRMVEEHIGEPPEQVAAQFGCSPAHVRAARMRYCVGGDLRRGEPDPRHPETGEPRKDDPRKAEAIRLHGLGTTTVRGLALRLGVPKSTVDRWLAEFRGERAA